MVVDAVGAIGAEDGAGAGVAQGSGKADTAATAAEAVDAGEGRLLDVVADAVDDCVGEVTAAFPLREKKLEMALGLEVAVVVVAGAGVGAADTAGF